MLRLLRRFQSIILHVHKLLATPLLTRWSWKLGNRELEGKALFTTSQDLSSSYIYIQGPPTPPQHIYKSAHICWWSKLTSGWFLRRIVQHMMRLCGGTQRRCLEDGASIASKTRTQEQWHRRRQNLILDQVMGSVLLTIFAAHYYFTVLSNRIQSCWMMESCVHSCRFARLILFADAHSTRPAEKALAQLEEKLQAIYRRPYLPQGAVERCLLMLNALLQVRYTFFFTSRHTYLLSFWQERNHLIGGDRHRKVHPWAWQNHDFLTTTGYNNALSLSHMSFTTTLSLYSGNGHYRCFRLSQRHRPCSGSKRTDCSVRSSYKL